MNSLEDTYTPAMDGNCAKAEKGWGKNEAYPCIDRNVTCGCRPSCLFLIYMARIGR
jgi:hypothetical protein